MSEELAEDRDTARLVTRIQAGDRDQFATLYQRYFDRVYAYLRLVLRDSHEAEDVTQQVFVEIFEALPRYERRRQPFRAWLFTIVRNQGVSQLRKSNRLDLTAPEKLLEQTDGTTTEGNGGRVIEWISDEDLMLFVERLPLAQRQVLLLRFMLDLNANEIAKILERTPESVRILQHRALRFLEQRLVALGREPRNRRRARMSNYLRPANVLRSRRFALR
jgi:RNA polymerase sigma-70 factor (ECF subfamily)